MTRRPHKTGQKTRAGPVIPPRKNRTEQRPYDEELYKLRHLVENAFLHLKDGAASPQICQTQNHSSRQSRSGVSPYGLISRDHSIYYYSCRNSLKSWGKDRTLHVVAAANENTGRCADDGVANGTNGAYSFGEKAVRSGVMNPNQRRRSAKETVTVTGLSGSGRGFFSTPAVDNRRGRHGQP